MTYQRKSEFIDGLKEALSRCGITEQREIILDFEQHFSDGAAAGETEAQTCEKLGDPEEIAKQYIPDMELSLGEPPKKPEPLHEAEQLQNSEPIPPAPTEAPLASGFDAEGTAAAPESGAQSTDRVFEAGEGWEASFPSSDLRRIDVKIASAVARIAAADTDSAEVFYRAGRSGIRFAARMENGTLFVRESADFSVLPLAHASELEVTLPRREYEEFALSLASGKVFAEDLTGERFTAEIASGSAILGIFADEIDLTLRSGNAELSNCLRDEYRTVHFLKLENNSGKTVVRDFPTDRFELELKSGSMTAEGISGKGSVSLKSGFLTLGYADWSNDLSVNAASGTTKVTLPRGSGAYLYTNVRSGGVTAELDGETARFSRGNGSGRVGGGNQHQIDISLSSGSVRIENNTNTASPHYAGQNAQGLPPAPPPAPKQNGADAGKIVGVLCVDVFVFSWAIPVLASLVAALFACAFSLGVTGITTFVGGMMMGVTDVSGWFTSGFSPVSTVLLGALMTTGCVLLALASCAAATGFINTILRIVNWHSRAFVGRNVCTLIGKKYRVGKE